MLINQYFVVAKTMWRAAPTSQSGPPGPLGSRHIVNVEVNSEHTSAQSPSSETGIAARFSAQAAAELRGTSNHTFCVAPLIRHAGPGLR